MHEVTPSLGTRPRRSLSERMAEKISPEPNSGCWLWTGSLCPAGYGKIYFDGGAKYAHRLSYQMARGVIPADLEVDHKCRVRCCVNPDHLEPVSHAENVRRGVGPLRTKQLAAEKTHCKRGHALFGENLYMYDGHRCCKECRRQEIRTRRARNRLAVAA